MGPPGPWCAIPARWTIPTPASGSHAELAEIGSTVFACNHVVTAQLILRRIKGRAALTRFMPIAAISPFITSAELSSAANVEIFHHQHAII